MKKNAVPKDEYNLMGLYFNQGSPTFRIIGAMRMSLFTGRKADVSYANILAAQQEIEQIKRNIDASYPQFGQDLNGVFFGESDVRALQLIKGNFKGRHNGIEETFIPMDFGTNPWQFYKGPDNYDTLDTRLTIESAKDYLMSNRKQLRERGFEGFEITESSFWYFDNDMLVRNFGDSLRKVNFHELVPFIADVKDFVGFQPTKKPSRREYNERIIPLISYRQKQSLQEKLERELCSPNPYANLGDVVSDLGAHRIVDKTEQGAITWGETFKRDFKIGRFSGRVMHVDDYYARPKKTGFKAFNIAVAVSSSKFPETAREVQIYDTDIHYIGHIDPKSPANHRKVRESQRRSLKDRKRVLENFEYDAILEMMFGRRVLYLPVPENS